jgi:CubicO group peptidase (beta-lactamase class C family)
MLASISKTVIATAVMQGVERALFGLDDDVNDILPFPVRTPEHPRRVITVRQLLTHTSSIRDRWPVWDDLDVRRHDDERRHVERHARARTRLGEGDAALPDP